MEEMKVSSVEKVIAQLTALGLSEEESEKLVKTVWQAALNHTHNMFSVFNNAGILSANMAVGALRLAVDNLEKEING